MSLETRFGPFLPQSTRVHNETFENQKSRRKKGKRFDCNMKLREIIQRTKLQKKMAARVKKKLIDSCPFLQGILSTINTTT